MQFEEHGERIQDLKVVLERVAYAATLFDPDGVNVRFMNTNLPNGVGDNIRDVNSINQLLTHVKYQGLTPMGRELRRKVVDGIVLRDARQGGLKKPVLVIVITDGQPAGDDSPEAVFDTIRYAVAEVQRATGNAGSISFQFAQVGNDTKAREFLGRLDSDAQIGDSVDVTSNYEQEQAEMLQQQPPVDLTPDLWCVKLLLGAIDPSYDSKDEVRSYRPGGGPGARPQQPPPQQQGYGQYGQSGGQYQPPPQHSQYGGPPQPGGYGGPPPTGGYGGPQQGYGAPPPGSYGGAGSYGPPPPPRY